MTKEKENAAIISQEEIAHGIYSMWIRTKAAETAEPGQFISMYTNDGSKLLPRPISICEIDKEKGALRVVYRVTGENTGTELFSQMGEGDTIPVIGPLGNGFPLEKALEKRAFLIGGGIGVPPILELAKQIGCEKKQIIVGYRNDETFLKTEFEQNGEVYISTEDGSAGTKGNVMDAIRENGLEADIIYACGTDTDAPRDQKLCGGKRDRMLYFAGRAHGMRYRSMSCMCMQDERKRSSQ